jgi:hypothetical protein
MTPDPAPPSSRRGFAPPPSTLSHAKNGGRVAKKEEKIISIPLPALRGTTAGAKRSADAKKGDEGKSAEDREAEKALLDGDTSQTLESLPCGAHPVSGGGGRRGMVKGGWRSTAVCTAGRLRACFAVGLHTFE